MSARRLPRRMLFTPEEANAALPLVRVIVRDVVRLARDVVDRRERLSFLLNRKGPDPSDFYRDELAQVQANLEDDAQRLREYIRELADLGVEPKSATEGLVDFPSEMDGRRVYLCWKLGEPEVLYWHEVEDGFAGRQPLVAGAAADEGLGSSARADAAG